VLQVTVSETGDTTCAELVSGNPMVVGSAIRSVQKWKFLPLVTKRLHKAYYGRLAIKFHATETAVKFKVIDAPDNVGHAYEAQE